MGQVKQVVGLGVALAVALIAVQSGALEWFAFNAEGDGRMPDWNGPGRRPTDPGVVRLEVDGQPRQRDDRNPVLIQYTVNGVTSPVIPKSRLPWIQDVEWNQVSPIIVTASQELHSRPSGLLAELDCGIYHAGGLVHSDDIEGAGAVRCAS